MGSEAHSGAGSIDALKSLSRDDELFLVAAENELTSRCMTAQGFRYVAISPFDYPDVSKPRGATDTQLADRSYRDVHGYGIGEHLDASNKGDEEGAVLAAALPNKRIYDALSTDQRLAYNRAIAGSGKKDVSVTLPGGMTMAQSTDGCTAEARKQIYGDLERHLRLSSTVNHLRSERDQRVGSDKAVESVRSAWSDCMKEKQVMVESPDDLKSKVAETYHGKGIRSATQFASASGQSVFLEEKRLAIADFDCDQSVGYSKVFQERRSVLEGKVIGDREGEIFAYHELVKEATAKAKTLVGNDPARQSSR